MHIAVNLRAYVHNGIGGLGTVVRVLIAGLERKHRLTIFAQPGEFENVRAFAPGSELREASRIPAEITEGAFDLLFCPLLVLEPLSSGIPSVVLIPDLQHEYFPEYFTAEVLAWRRRFYRASVQAADAVLTVSEFSKHTIAKHLGAEMDRIVVIDHGVEPEFDQPADSETRAAADALGLAPDFLLFPSNFWPHKNHSNLLRAMKILVTTGNPDLELVLTGEHNFGLERIQAEVSSLNLERNVRTLGFLPRPVLAEVCRRARVLVFVSRFEGFGIPILEGFHAATPVVTSRMESCVEVAGGAALLVDERDPEDIASGLNRVIHDTILRARLMELGRNRMQTYSWEHAVSTVTETFERILMEGGGGRRPAMPETGDEIRYLREQLASVARHVEQLEATDPRGALSAEMGALAGQVTELTAAVRERRDALEDAQRRIQNQDQEITLLRSQVAELHYQAENPSLRRSLEFLWRALRGGR